MSFHNNYLVLDIGNVLVNQDIEPFVQAVSRQMNLSKSEVTAFVNRIQKKQDLGLATVSDELVTHFDIKSEYIISDLMDSWYEVVQPNKAALDFFSTLMKEWNVKVALLSNVGEEHRKHFDKIMSGNLVYDASIHHFSCKVGARKPTGLYYKLFLQDHPEFKGCMYLDDLLENLVSGHREGFQTMHWDLSLVPWDTIPTELSSELTQHYRALFNSANLILA